jgi:hypothetical protein
MQRSVVLCLLVLAPWSAACAVEGVSVAPADCPADGLASLAIAGLSPSFAPATTDYRVAPPAGGTLELTATPCDPAVAVYARSNPLTAGRPASIWVGDGGPVDVVLYRNWREVSRYTVRVDASLPPQPPPPAFSGLTVPGLTPAFDPRVAEYTVPPPAHDLLPVTAVTDDPAVTLYVQSTPVRSGETFDAWLPADGQVDVVAYRGWVEVGRITIRIDPDLIDGPGRLYVAGGKGLDTVDLKDFSVASIPFPGDRTSWRLARSPDHAHVYATSPKEGFIAAVSTKTHQVDQSVVYPPDTNVWPSALVVRPGGLRLDVVDAHSPVLLSFDPTDLAAGADLSIIPGVSLPEFVYYRPDSLDLYVSDFQTDGDNVAIRRPSIDFEDGTIDFGWKVLSLPHTQTNQDGDSAAGIAFLPEQGLIAVTNSRGDELVILDQDSLEVLTRISVPAMPYYITTDPSSNADVGRIWLVTYQSAGISVYDVTRGDTGGVDLALAKRFDPCTTYGPVAVAFADDPDAAYVLCWGGVQELNAHTFEVQRSASLHFGDASDLVWARR